MRGERKFKILSLLNGGKNMALDALGAYLIMGLSYNPKKGIKASRDFLRMRENDRAEKEEGYRQTRRFYTFVRYLEQDGLVRREIVEKKIFVEITPRGKERLKGIKSSKSLSFPTSKYEKKDSSQDSNHVATIITFDIPEKERAKRDWLRYALNNLNCNMIHKSVWMGKQGVPDKFLEDLRDMKMGDYVEIFAITKMGSLKKLM